MVKFLPVNRGQTKSILVHRITGKPKPVHARQGNDKPPVIAFLKGCDTAGTADLKQIGYRILAVLRRACRVNRLHHANQPCWRGKRIIDHRQIARLKDIQRQLPARQQQRIW